MFLAPSPNVRLISFAFESSELAKMAWLHSPEQCSYGHDLALITKHTAPSCMGIKYFYLWCTHKQGVATPCINKAILLKINCGP